MYSPGAVNFAVVVAFPSGSGVGLAFSKATSPGPLNLLQKTEPPKPRPPRGGLSSDTHSVRASGSATFADRVRAIPCGGPVKEAPLGSNLRTGGVFPLPASFRGSTTHSGFRLIGIDVVWPLATIVQVSFFVPKSLGTTIRKTPHCLRGRNVVGCP